MLILLLKFSKAFFFFKKKKKLNLVCVKQILQVGLTVALMILKESCNYKHPLGINIFIFGALVVYLVNFLGFFFYKKKSPYI